MGGLLAGGDQFGQIHLVDPNTGKYIKRLEGHSDEVDAISFSADMRTFASGSIDGTLYIWDIASGEKNLTIDGFVNPFTSDDSFGVSADGKTIATWAVKGCVYGMQQRVNVEKRLSRVCRAGIITSRVSRMIRREISFQLRRLIGSRGIEAKWNQWFSYYNLRRVF